MPDLKVSMSLLAESRFCPVMIIAGIWCSSLALSLKKLSFVSYLN